MFSKAVNGIAVNSVFWHGSTAGKQLLGARSCLLLQRAFTQNGHWSYRGVRVILTWLHGNRAHARTWQTGGQFEQKRSWARVISTNVGIRFLVKHIFSHIP